MQLRELIEWCKKERKPLNSPFVFLCDHCVFWEHDTDPGEYRCYFRRFLPYDWDHQEIRQRMGKVETPASESSFWISGWDFLSILHQPSESKDRQFDQVFHNIKAGDFLHVCGIWKKILSIKGGTVEFDPHYQYERPKHTFKAWALKDKETGKLKPDLDYDELPLLLQLPMRATVISMFVLPKEFDKYLAVNVDVTVKERR